MKHKKGFTLVELLAVIVILGVLLSITTVAVNNIRKKQDVKNYQNVISSILSGAKQYATDNNLSTESIAVEELLNGEYVEFDRNEFSNLVGKSVEIQVNDVKRKFYIEVEIDKDGDGDDDIESKYTVNKNNGKVIFNDCGLEDQATGMNSVANELCID